MDTKGLADAVYFISINIKSVKIECYWSNSVRFAHMILKECESSAVSGTKFPPQEISSKGASFCSCNLNKIALYEICSRKTCLARMCCTMESTLREQRSASHQQAEFATVGKVNKE
jgi:hypothetical protein